MNDPLLIGVDNATDGPTGIVVAWYHPVRGAEVLASETVKGLSAITHIFYMIREMYPAPLALATEDGFFSRQTPKGGISTWISRGWVEGIATMLWPDIIIRSYKAQQWRSIFRGCGCRTTEEWKAHVLTWASVEPLIKDEHQADALGIVSKLGEELAKEGVITCG